jgi:hypothetical protein
MVIPYTHANFYLVAIERKGSVNIALVPHPLFGLKFFYQRCFFEKLVIVFSGQSSNFIKYLIVFENVENQIYYLFL